MPSDAQSTADLHTVYIIGNVRNVNFHKARYVAESLAEKSPANVVSKIGCLCPTEWDIYCDLKLSSDIPKKAAKAVEQVLIFVLTTSNGKRRSDTGVVPVDVSTIWSMHNYKSESPETIYRDMVPPKAVPIQDLQSFRNWARETFHFDGELSADKYQEHAENFWTKWQQSIQHPIVEFIVTIDGSSVGSLVFELFPDVCPKTVQNFLKIAAGKEKSPSGKPLAYSNSLFHRIVKGGWVQGGDVLDQHGSGSESIYGPTFEDESFAIPFLHRGMLAMANRGKHTNGSQFFVTAKAMPCFDKLYVAFGRLIDGQDVLKALENVETVYPEKPVKTCRVEKSFVIGQ